MAGDQIRRDETRYSFIIPCYNYAHFLPRAVKSIWDQAGKFSDQCEILLIDDGSTDDTFRVCEDLCAENPAIRYVFQDNAGPSAARNHGAGIADGDYLWFVDADDELLPGAIEAMDEATEQYPQAAMIFGGYRSHATDGRRVEKLWSKPLPDLEQSFLRCITGKLTGLCIGSSVIRREVFLRYQFPVEIQNGEDFILYAHIIANEPFRSTPRLMINTFRHEGSLRANLEKNEETGLGVIDELFDEERLPASLMSLKPRYIAHRHLELARTYYLVQNYPRTKFHYLQAVAVYPMCLFQLSYLRKYLRAVLRAWAA